MSPDTINIGIILIITHLFVIIFGIGFFLIYRVLKKAGERRDSFTHKLISSLLLPLNFTAIFLEKRRERHLPLYFRLFLKFTKYCSKIPYFHFLPKFCIATTSELLVRYFTGHELLTGLVFLWSMSFFIIVSFVEGQFGELEEESVTLANKIFLYSVSILTVIVLIIGKWFWGLVGPSFDNGFWRFISSVAELFNKYLLDGLSLLIRHPMAIIAALVILVIYVSSSIYLSNYLKNKP